MSTHLFAYGILMNPDLLFALTGKQWRVEPAILKDYGRYTMLKEGWSRLAVCEPRRGEEIKGVVVYDVDDITLHLLDAFECLDIGLYRRITGRVTVPDNRELDVQIYQGGGEAIYQLGALWSPGQFLARYFDEYLYNVIPAFLEDYHK